MWRRWRNGKRRGDVFEYGELRSGIHYRALQPAQGMWRREGGRRQRQRQKWLGEGGWDGGSATEDVGINRRISIDEAAQRIDLCSPAYVL